jgi:hypothetical protein
MQIVTNCLLYKVYYNITVTCSYELFYIYVYIYIYIFFFQKIVADGNLQC